MCATKMMDHWTNNAIRLCKTCDVESDNLIYSYFALFILHSILMVSIDPSFQVFGLGNIFVDATMGLSTKKKMTTVTITVMPRLFVDALIYAYQNKELQM